MVGKTSMAPPPLPLTPNAMRRSPLFAKRSHSCGNSETFKKKLWVSSPNPRTALPPDRRLEKRALHQRALCSLCRLAQWLLQLLSLIHISEPTRQAEISYAVFCLKKKKKKKTN